MKGFGEYCSILNVKDIYYAQHLVRSRIYLQPDVAELVLGRRSRKLTAVSSCCETTNATRKNTSRDLESRFGHSRQSQLPLLQV